MTRFLAACALVEKGASLYGVDKKKCNCLHYVLRSPMGKISLLYLADKLGDRFIPMATAINYSGKSPLDFIFEKKINDETATLSVQPRISELTSRATYNPSQKMKIIKCA